MNMSAKPQPPHTLTAGRLCGYGLDVSCAYEYAGEEIIAAAIDEDHSTCELTMATGEIFYVEASAAVDVRSRDWRAVSIDLDPRTGAVIEGAELFVDGDDLEEALDSLDACKADRPWMSTTTWNVEAFGRKLLPGVYSEQ